MVDKYDIELKSDDYWDSEQEQFVMTYGADSKILTQAKIKDHDGVIWDCYLVGVEYLESDIYVVYYAQF